MLYVTNHFQELLTKESKYHHLLGQRLGRGDGGKFSLQNIKRAAKLQIFLNIFFRFTEFLHLKILIPLQLLQKLTKQTLQIETFS